jgi:hypothetical protein
MKELHRIGCIMEKVVKREITLADKDIIQAINNSEKETSFISKLKNRNAIPDSIFQLKEISSIGGIRYIAPYLFHSNLKVRDIAAQKIHELFLLTENKDLQWLDESIRGGYYYRYDLVIQRKWYDLGTGNIKNLELPKEKLSSILCVLSCHSSGYIREAALKRLINVDPVSAVKMLLIRVNDWVSKIRSFATSSLAKLVRQLDESQLADFLILVEQLRNRSRQDHSEIILEVEKRFSTSMGQSELVKAIKHTDYRVARSAFLIARRLVESKEKVFDVGSDHKDPLIRSWTLELAQQYFSGDELTEYLLRVSQDKLGMLRKRAIYKLLEIDYKLARSSLMNCLSDSSSVMREMARFYINREEEFNYAEYYRNSLKDMSGAKLAGLITGLAETGSERDWEVVLSYENHSTAKVRAAVILASKKLTVSDNNWLYSKITDGCPCEIKAAKQVLLSRNEYSEPDVINLHSDYSGGYKGKVLRQLIEKKCYWQAVKALLETMINKDEDYSRELSDWLDKNGSAYWYVKPETKLLVDILELINIAKVKLGRNRNLNTLHEMTEKLNNWKI